MLLYIVGQVEQTMEREVGANEINFGQVTTLVPAGKPQLPGLAINLWELEEVYQIEDSTQT